MQRPKISLIDDDPTLFDLPAEWLFPDLPREEARRRDDTLGLRALAADVELQSGRQWPSSPRRARRGRAARRTQFGGDGGHFPDAA